MRAIMVAVDYTDLLAVTLPYNIHHFEEVWIVTDEKCHKEVVDVAWQMDNPHKVGITILATGLFYADGATFNKWRALEWGLDQMGRHGWLCLMDADVLWPKGLRWSENTVETESWKPNVETLQCSVSHPDGTYSCHVFVGGYLYTPLRRMCTDLNQSGFLHMPEGVWKPYPAERLWNRFPVHRNINEWAGYSQIFHADDPVLGPPPWHETNWKHAGGADSFFQMRWPKEKKVRPPFEVLHLGPAGENWYGRATPYLDGSVPTDAAEKREKVRQIWEGRRAARVRHGPDSSVYAAEKLSPRASE